MSPQLLCAISYSLKRLGAALYDEDEREIKTVLDLAEDNDFVMLSQLLRESRPTLILANRSQDAEFQMFLRKECNHLMPNLIEESAIDPLCNDSTVPETLNISVMMPSQTQMVSSRMSINSPQRASNKFNDESTGSHFMNQSEANDEKEEVEDSLWHPTIHFLPDMAFSFGLAKNRIVQLFEDGVNDPNMVASFRFDFSSTNMIRSLGALFRFLEQQKAGPQQKDENNQNINFNIRSCFDKINTYFLENCIEVDSTTIRALEIFYSEYIPKSIRQKFVWGNNRREGMSLFKLCNVCRSTPGKQMLRMWFERPTKDMKVLTERHEAIAYLYQDCNLEITRGLRAFVKDISAVKGIFNRMRRGNAALTDWKNFFVTICTLVKIGKYLDEYEVNLPIFRGRHQCLGGRLQEVAALLTEVVDFQESSTENRIVICKGIDPDLDEKKDRYEHLPEELTEVAKMEAVDLNMDGCSVAYVPIIGYLLMLAETAPPLKSTSSLVELIFSSDGTSYYKTERMRMLDEELGDIKMQIVDAERNILMNLEKRLLQFRNIVLQAIGLGATLDCLISLASVSRNFNWVRPTFVDKPSLFIEHARHPVAEHLCKSLRDFVPNPIFSSTDLGKIKILFGPNASGKSVYLKTVGTIVYMAHVGCFVPASRAIIGPINRIMSRIYSVDSVLDGMSSFANDLKQMSRAISRSDQNSLLIIDEFGKGTMTEVGLSLLASSLNYWLEGPIERCPHVVVASHFHSLPELLHDPNELVRFQTMGVSRLEDDSLEFHFNLMDGLTDLSYANFTALKMGIPRKVIDRAEEIYLHLRAGGTFTELAPIPLNQTALVQLTHGNEDYEYEEEDVEVEVEEEELIYEQE